jgi:hypothetical protein
MEDKLAEAARGFKCEPSLFTFDLLGPKRVGFVRSHTLQLRV